MQDPHVKETVFAEPRAKTCLIIGVLNEGDRITRQLESLQPFRAEVDILIADGGSTDGATAPEALKGKVSRLVTLHGGNGLSQQYHFAIRAALKAGYRSLLFMDGNGKDGPETIPAFLAKLEEGFDFIQGSRFLKGGRHANTPHLRVLGIRLVAVPLFRLASGFHYTDPLNGFKACSHRFLTEREGGLLRDIFGGYTLQYYMNYIAPRIGMKVTEIPVSRVYPSRRGPVVSKIIGVRGYARVLRQILSVLTGRYDPHDENDAEER